MSTLFEAAQRQAFIVDNSAADRKVVHHVREWCLPGVNLDIATGTFEIGGLLALGEHWPKTSSIRILMGDEVSLRTKAAFDRALARLASELNESLEEEKKQNDFLTGVDAIVQAMSTRKISCRIYTKDKFHAKAYIARSADQSVATVGSSNLTAPGLTENVELNTRHVGADAMAVGQWFDEHWEQAEDVTDELLKTIQRHVREYTPFEVYAKSLREFFRDHDMSDTRWERDKSRVYNDLDKYQQDGYHNLLRIAADHGGAFLCDGVGLGKTFVGLMLIERLVLHEGKRVLLLVPKGVKESVWDPQIEQRLKHIPRFAFNTLMVMCHTDLLRGGETAAKIEEAKQHAQVVIVDEAHHFRNPGTRGETPIDLSLFTDEARAGQIKGIGKVKPSRYRKLFELAENKPLFLLTATPINNELSDLRHMIELFSRRREDHFGRSLGINSLRAHFIAMEKQLEALAHRRGEGDASIETDLEQAREVLTHDRLFKSLVVQRSRSYVRDSQVLSGSALTSFPQREDPKVAEYSVKKTYGKLLDMVENSFDKKKLFSLAIYYPLAYLRNPDADVDKFAANRQKQVVGLIRTQFLKRFESSVKAFELSCERLLLKLLAFVTSYATTPAEKRKLDIWKLNSGDLIGLVRDHQLELFGGEEEEPSEDLISDEMLEDVRDLSEDVYDIPKMVDESLDDLNALSAFLKETQTLKPADDDKLRTLKSLLKTDSVLKKHKVLIFTEFSDTARYLRAQLDEAGIKGIAEVDGDTKGRESVIRRFAPYYNGSSSAELSNEIRVLISTDVLSEGLNLQDASRMINYDLHWNPVRLMQRIGRVDRRLDPDIEQRLVADHPDVAPLRGKIAYWNFLPPGDLDRLLKLYEKVSHKTLRISRTLGIETGKLLRDSHHCGVTYGFYDLGRILDTLAFVRVGEGDPPTLKVAIEPGGRHAAEGMILARYFMFEQVYFQKTRMAYDHHGAECLKEAIGAGKTLPDPNTPAGRAKYLKMDDWFLFQHIRSSQSRHAQAILQHRHDRLVHETSEVASANELREHNSAMDKLRKKGAKPWSTDASKSWYKTGLSEILVADESSRANFSRGRPLAAVSETAGKIRDSSQQRIYVPLEKADEAMRLLKPKGVGYGRS